MLSGTNKPIMLSVVAPLKVPERQTSPDFTNPLGQLLDATFAIYAIYEWINRNIGQISIKFIIVTAHLSQNLQDFYF